MLFRSIMSQMDEFIRYANKYWSDGSRQLAEDDIAARRQLLLDCSFLLRACTLLMHPVVPAGTEMICEYLAFDPAVFFSWEYAFESLDELCSEAECKVGFHAIKELPPRTDFFAVHPSQIKEK